MRIAVHQPNYAPWCGYFAKMRACDVFILQDDVQFSRGGYVNRVQIQTTKAGGAAWLTIPVPKGSTGLLINQLCFGDPKWNINHLRELKKAYGGAAHFDEIYAIVEPIYQSAGDSVANFNTRLIRAFAECLQIQCEFRIASEIGAAGKADDRLVDLVQKVGGKTYVSGAGGQNYQEREKFERAGLQLEVRVYKPVRYQQRGEEFLPGLSIVDALFHCGSGGARELLVYGDGIMNGDCGPFPSLKDR